MGLQGSETSKEYLGTALCRPARHLHIYTYSRADKLDRVLFRMGLLAALRSKCVKGRVIVTIGRPWYMVAIAIHLIQLP